MLGVVYGVIKFGATFIEGYLIDIIVFPSMTSLHLPQPVWASLLELNGVIPRGAGMERHEGG